MEIFIVAAAAGAAATAVAGAAVAAAGASAAKRQDYRHSMRRSLYKGDSVYNGQLQKVTPQCPISVHDTLSAKFKHFGFSQAILVSKFSFQNQVQIPHPPKILVYPPFQCRQFNSCLRGKGSYTLVQNASSSAPTRLGPHFLARRGTVLAPAIHPRPTHHLHVPHLSQALQQQSTHQQSPVQQLRLAQQQLRRKQYIQTQVQTQQKKPCHSRVQDSQDCLMLTASGSSYVYVLRPSGLHRTLHSATTVPVWSRVELPSVTSLTTLAASPGHAFLGSTDGTLTSFPHGVNDAEPDFVQSAALHSSVSALLFVDAVGVFVGCTDGSLALLEWKEIGRFCKGHRKAVLNMFRVGSEGLPGQQNGQVMRNREGQGSMLHDMSLEEDPGYIDDHGVSAFASDSDFLYVGGNDGIVSVWDLKSRVRLREISLARGTGRVSALFRAGPLALWVGFYDGTVRVWDVRGDSEAGVEEVANERVGRLPVSQFVLLGGEVWSTGEQVMKWRVEFPSLVGEVGMFSGSHKELVIVRSVRTEKVELWGLLGDGLEESLGCSAQQAVLEIVDDAVEGIRTEDRKVANKTAQGALGRAEVGAVVEKYNQAHDAVKKLLHINGSVDQNSLANLLRAVEGMTNQMNGALARVCCGCEATAVSGKPHISDTSDDEGSSALNETEVPKVEGVARGAFVAPSIARENSNEEGRPARTLPTTSGVGREYRSDIAVPGPVSEALSGSLVRARALLPSVRVGDKRGPLAKELESAMRLLELWKTEGDSAGVHVGGRSSENCENAVAFVAQGQKVVTAMNEAEELRETIAKSKQETAAAKEGLREAQEELISLRCIGNTSSSRLAVAEAEREVLREELEALHTESSETIRGMERRLRERSAQVDSVKTELAAVESKLGVESRDRAKQEIELDRKLDVIESLRRQHRNAENALLEKSAELSAVESQLEGENHALDSIRAQMQEVEDSRQEAQETLATQVEELLVATGRTETALAEVSRLRVEVENSEANLSEQQGLISSLRGQLATERAVLGEERSAMRQAERERETLLVSCQQLKEDLKQERVKRKEAEDAMHGQVAQLKQMADSVKHQLSTDTAELESELGEAHTEMSSLHKDLAEQAKDLETSQSLVSSLKRKLAASVEETRLLRLAESARLAELDKGRSAYNLLKDAMESLKDDYDRSEMRNADLSLSFQTLQEAQEQGRGPRETARTPGFFANDSSLSEGSAQIRTLRLENLSLEQGNRNREKECTQLRETVEHRDDELRRARVANQEREGLLSVLEGRVRDLEAERDSIQDALESQLAATASLGSQIADRDDICDGLNSRIAELEQRKFMDLDSMNLDFDGVVCGGLGDPDCFSEEVKAALAESQQAVDGMQRKLGTVTSIANRLQHCASTHRESLPILLELGRELERQNGGLVQGAGGVGGQLDAAIKVLKNMIALLFTEAEKEVALGSDYLGEVHSFAASPIRAAELQSQLSVWRAKRLSEPTHIVTNTPKGDDSGANVFEGEQNDPPRMNPRRFLRF